MLAVMALAFTAWLLASSTWQDVRVVAAVAAVGVALYAPYARRSAQRRLEEGVASPVKL